MIKKTTEIDAILLNLNKAIDAHGDAANLLI